MRSRKAIGPRYMVAQASARQNRTPPGHFPWRGSSSKIDDTDEKATEEKPTSKHICSNAARESACENTSIRPGSPSKGICPLITESLISVFMRDASTLGASVPLARAAPALGIPAPSCITACSPSASKPSSANTPCATHNLPPGANTRANSASEAGRDHTRFMTLLIYTRSKGLSPIRSEERFSGMACENRRQRSQDAPAQ